MASLLWWWWWWWVVGDYTVMGGGNEGLPQWTAKNRNVKDTDVVLWHSFGWV